MKKRNKTFVAFCAAFIFLFGILIFVREPQKFSESENRALARRPDISLNSIMSGKFSEGLSGFCRDQFPLRSGLIKLVNAVETVLGRCENNGIIMGKDGHLIARSEYNDFALLEKNMSAFSDFAAFAGKSGKKVTFFAAPRSTDVFASYLPDIYSNERANAVWDKFSALCGDYASITQELRGAAESGQYVWFGTDHHWTAQGAYLAYSALAEKLDYEAAPQNFFEAERFSDTFYGTSYSKAQPIFGKPDSVDLYRYPGDNNFTVTDKATGVTSRGFYDFSAALKKDKYTVFLGGNSGHEYLAQRKQWKSLLLSKTALQMP